MKSSKDAFKSFSLSVDWENLQEKLTRNPDGLRKMLTIKEKQAISFWSFNRFDATENQTDKCHVRFENFVL